MKKNEWEIACNAKRKGSAAYHDGKPLEANPYIYGSPGYLPWTRAWRAAESVHEHCINQVGINQQSNQGDK